MAPWIEQVLPQDKWSPTLLHALGLVLAFEPSESDVMRRPPRDRDAALISGFLAWRVALVCVVQTIGSLGLFLWETASGAPVEQARTLAVNALVVGQIFYLFNSRYTVAPSTSLAGLTGNRVALLGIAILLLAYRLVSNA